MARPTDTDHFDDDDDTRPTGKRKFPGLTIVILIAVPAAAVVLIGGGFAVFWARDSANFQRAVARDAADARATAATKRVCTRDQFKALVGATPDDVTATAGAPQFRIQERNRTTWVYRNKTQDPALGRIDPVTNVVFDGGVVIEVKFQAAEPIGKAK